MRDLFLTVYLDDQSSTVPNMQAPEIACRSAVEACNRAQLPAPDDSPYISSLHRSDRTEAPCWLTAAGPAAAPPCRLVIIDGWDPESLTGCMTADKPVPDELDPIAWALKSEDIPLADTTRQDCGAARGAGGAPRDLDRMIFMHHSVQGSVCSNLEENSSKFMLWIEI